MEPCSSSPCCSRVHWIVRDSFPPCTDTRPRSTPWRDWRRTTVGTRTTTRKGPGATPQTRARGSTTATFPSVKVRHASRKCFHICPLSVICCKGFPYRDLIKNQLVACLTKSSKVCTSWEDQKFAQTLLLFELNYLIKMLRRYVQIIKLDVNSRYNFLCLKRLHGIKPKNRLVIK